MRHSQSRTEDWNLMLVATSETLADTLLPRLGEALTACGGRVLSQGEISPACADIDFEFPRAHSMEVYSLLVATGVALSLEAHQQLTELCQCTLQLKTLHRERSIQAGRRAGDRAKARAGLLTGDRAGDRAESASAHFGSTAAARVHLSIYAGEGADSFLAGALGTLSEAA